MTLDMANKMIDDIAMFPEKPKMIRICGDGENLLNPDFLDIAKIIYERNICDNIVLVTNGIQLYPKISDELVNYVNQITVSTKE